MGLIFSLRFMIVVFLLASLKIPSHTLFHQLAANIATNTAEKKALLSFKALITDPSNRLSSWNQSSHLICNWTGVSCSKINQRVVGLDLKDLKLSGTITPYLANLSFLASLHLQSNQFTGLIPDEIGALSQLRVLNMSNNHIQGAIPPNITRCSKLQVLDLSANVMSGKIPQNLQRLSKLRVLKLNQNQFHGEISPSLGNLSNSLAILDLGTNLLTGAIPGELGRLRNLEKLEFSINNLTGNVPSSIYNISSLVFFGLASNRLIGEVPQDIGDKLPNLKDYHICFNGFTGGIPGTLHNLTNIQSIRMSWNFLTGQLPRGLGNLPNLLMYNIGYNRITSSSAGDDAELIDFINSLTNSTRLQYLAFDGNLVEGIIPESIGNLSTDLVKLYMGENRIKGPLPPSIGRLRNLALLNLSHNSIVGQIPTEISELKELQMLGLAGNRISGEIPTFLTEKLTKLSKLELYGNQIAGSIPSTIGNLESLLSLDLSNNMLVGSIPPEVFKLSSLSSLLNLSKNSLTGPLPNEVRNLKNVVTMDLSHNRLSGLIPDSIDDCKSLEKLLMSENLFEGRVPESLGRAKGLEVLDLSSNKLSGPIPKALQELKALHLLNLSFNDLEGKVPPGDIFRNLTITHLEGNSKLCLPFSTCDNTQIDQYHGRKSITARRRIIIIISMVASIALTTCVAGWLLWFSFYRRRDSVNIAPSSSDLLKGKEQHRMITYNELKRATKDFAKENQIGIGSFACVYKGILGGGTDHVAVKVVNLNQIGAFKSFFAECEALRRVRHRNLVKLVTSCSSTDFMGVEFRALVYKFMENGSLDDWLRGRRRHGDGTGLNVVERLDIAIDVACAMEYLHHECDAPMIHCDVKPSNVLLDEDMTAKVGDFGLARLLIACGSGTCDPHSTSSTHGLIGSIGYIPPEYGMGGKPSTKGDVYSYGVLLLELFTGMSPTHEAFCGGMSLVKWVQSAFSNNNAFVEILDPELLRLKDDVKVDNQGECPRECFASILAIGLCCATDSIEARISMRDVHHKLTSVKDGLQKLACS